MLTLKKIISRYMRLITLFFVTGILILITYLQILIEQRRACDTAVRTFTQIEQILVENQKELTEIEEEYKQTCLHNAEIIACIIEGDPELLYNVNRLKDIARLVEVDEIHIFDQTGRIFAGTHPEYFNYTFDSGEQMQFFKPMLEDKSLQLVQEIMPNTAEGKIMQYSALWNQSKTMIVQIGMEPVSVMKMTEKNELSHLFSLLRVNPEANYYAVDAESGEIIGSTDPESVGKTPETIGLNAADSLDMKKGFHASVNGKSSYCVFKRVGDNYLGRIISTSELYQRIPTEIFVLAVCLAAIAFVLSHAVTKYMNRYVVEGIFEVNEKLRLIANGNLDERIDIQTSREFSELSTYINIMMKSLLDNNRKMSYVLTKTNLYIGVYEYNTRMKKVRFTEYIPRILSLTPDEAERLSSDYRNFREFMDILHEHPLPDEPGVFQISEQPEQYIRIEELSQTNEVFGVIIDVTDDIVRRRKIEMERDVDPLTGLYNRRGLYGRLAALFETPKQLGCSALIMIDADGLKAINDTCGHDKGDLYLQKIAALLSSFGSEGCVAARPSGDEFVLFLYGYPDEESLFSEIHHLEYLQNNSSAALDDTLTVPLRFSFGFSLTNGRTDYPALLKETDEKMYSNKRNRKNEKA